MDLQRNTESPILLDYVQTEHFSQWRNLLTRSFPVPKNACFFDDFPVWDPNVVPEGPRLLRVGAFQDRKLIATTGVRIALLKAPRFSLPIALIGAVTVEESHRQQGLATQIVTLALEWAKQSGAAMAVLWGSEHSLYGRLGFELCGRQQQVSLSELDLGSTSSEKTHRDWTPALFKCLQQREMGLFLEPIDLKWVEAHRNVEWFWTGSKDQPTAFAAYGRGIDLQGMVHEWGGKKEELFRLLEEIRELYPQASLLGPPDLIQELQLNSKSAPPTECMGLIRILNPSKIFSAYRNEPLAADEDAASGNWKIRTLGTSEMIMTPAQLARFFFGPSELIGNKQPPHSPFPLWIWGLDAV